jgi:hypothetical protein
MVLKTLTTSISRKLRDKSLLLFRHEWGWMKSKKFFVLFVKLAIFKELRKACLSISSFSGVPGGR